MNAADTIKGFLASNAYKSLAAEAEHNEHAVELLEIIDISIESLIFFKQNNIEDRVQYELYKLTNTFNYIIELYEEQ